MRVATTTASGPVRTDRSHCTSRRGIGRSSNKCWTRELGPSRIVTAMQPHLTEAVRKHFATYWRGHEQEDFVWTLGPIAERLPGFRVRRIAPSGPEDPWIYATLGASSAPGPGHTEFILLSPSENPRHVETLTMVAGLHADPQYRLSVGSTIDIGRPWFEGAVADHLLVSLPYPFGPELEHCHNSEHRIRVLWLVPITAAEAAYARSTQLEKFEELLESSGVDVLSPSRPSIVT